MKDLFVSKWKSTRVKWTVSGACLLLSMSGCADATETELAPSDSEPETGSLEESPSQHAETHGGGGAKTPWCAAKAILDKNCVGCHDGKGTAGTPMGLTSYADYQANAPITRGKKVYQAVFTRMHDATNPMPPRGILPAADLKVVDDWINAGAPAGSDPTCASSPSQPSGGKKDWDPSKCDEIYEIRAQGAGGAPYQVGSGESHPQISIDAPWGSERVQAINWKPITDSNAVHHWILYSGMTMLTGWAPGDEGDPAYPPTVGMDMPTGRGALRLDMHYYNTTGRAVPDRSGVAICVVKGRNLRPNSAAVTMSFTAIPRIPARAVNHETTGTCTVNARQPVHLLTASPHAHTYATRMKFSVRKRNGQVIEMLDEPFRFGEQATYPLKPEVILETGDVVTTTCVFTNPTNRTVTFGESTEDEMCFNFATYYPKGALSCSRGGGLLGGGSGLFGGGSSSGGSSGGSTRGGLFGGRLFGR